MFSLLVSPSIVGCASATKGAFAYPIDFQGHLAESPRTQSGLIIRARELNELSSPYFGAIEVTFENPTSHWVRISKVALDFRDRAKNAAVSATLGPDIESWAQATLQRNAVRRVNLAIGLEALAVTGALAHALAPKGAAGQTGAIVAVGATTALAAEQTSWAISEIEDVPLLPSYHLFAVPIAVAPALFVKRWIVLNNDGRTSIGCVRGVALDFETEQGLVEHVWLSFRYGHSEWQARACYVPSWSTAPAPAKR